MDALAAIESLLLERYNLTTPDDGDVFAAVALVRDEATEGSIAALRAELGRREFYIWNEAIWAAFNELAPTPKPQPANAEEPVQEKPRRGRKPSPVEPTT